MTKIVHEQTVFTANLEELIVKAMRAGGAVLPDDATAKIRFCFQNPGDENKRAKYMVVQITTHGVPETIFKPMAFPDPTGGISWDTRQTPPDSK